MAAAQYLGLGIYFNGDAAGTHCVDGTAYTGIKFDISGTVTGCTMQYSTNRQRALEQRDRPEGCGRCDGVRAAGDADGDRPRTTADVRCRSAARARRRDGNPALAVDKAKLTGVQWQFTVPAAATAACVVDITIDNVAFY